MRVRLTVMTPGNVHPGACPSAAPSKHFPTVAGGGRPPVEASDWPVHAIGGPRSPSVHRFLSRASSGLAGGRPRDPTARARDPRRPVTCEVGDACGDGCALRPRDTALRPSCRAAPGAGGAGRVDDGEGPGGGAEPPRPLVAPGRRPARGPAPDDPWL